MASGDVVITVPASATAGIGVVGIHPATYNNAITIVASVGTSSTALITAGGAATNRLEIFNNTGGNTPGTLWINPSGSTAVAGQGIPVFPGGSYTWQYGLAVIPQGISDNGTLSISGAGG
jgi:hypothetical protein